MEIQLSKVEFDLKYEGKENALINFRVNEEGDYFMQVFLDEDGWTPHGIYHDYDRNRSYGNCPFCQRKLKAGGKCESLRENVTSLYNRILDLPHIKLRALYKGMKKIEG